MKKFIASILAAFFVLLSPLSVLANTTTGQSYDIMPLELYDDNDSLQFTGYFSLGDYDLNKYSIHSLETDLFIVPTNVRFNNIFQFPNYPVSIDDFNNNNFNSIRFVVNITDLSSDNLFHTLIGLDSVFSGMGFGFSLYDWSNDGIGNLLENNFFSKPRKIEYRCFNVDDSMVYSGVINNNDITLFSGTGSFSFPLFIDRNVNNDSVSRIEFLVYYDLPNIDYSSYNFSHIVSTFAFRNNNENYIFGDFVPTSGGTGSSSEDDYNKNVEAELGNIQTGINNVINSVVQMGNQAWQGAQQTVQAVTQMTQQLNTAIDQQRQDILDGLGLLGDDITGTLSNVKTEITNMGTSITNKLESTTETITNTIENKVDEVTTAVEDVKQSVTEVKQSILDLPNKIKDMLLGLIVPDSDTMADKYSEFSGLLEQKLGVIYQIPMMLFDFFDTIVNAATTPQTTLTLPAFQLPWIDGTTLTVWQPMEYKIIPDGMQVLSDLIKTITSMTVVVLTFNSVKRAYERFLRS